MTPLYACAASLTIEKSAGRSAAAQGRMVIVLTSARYHFIRVARTRAFQHAARACTLRDFRRVLAAVSAVRSAYSRVACWFHADPLRFFGCGDRPGEPRDRRAGRVLAHLSGVACQPARRPLRRVGTSGGAPVLAPAM